MKNLIGPKMSDLNVIDEEESDIEMARQVATKLYAEEMIVQETNTDNDISKEIIDASFF